MSILKFINCDRCPECGCTTVIQEHKSASPHTMTGKYRESRYFDCGYAVEFSPNLDRTEHISHYRCCRSAAYVERQQQCKSVGLKILNYIKRLKIYPEFKERLLREVEQATKVYGGRL